ncbi:hypothetical protein ACFE04_016672 [Oxalis oulophora]
MNQTEPVPNKTKSNQHCNLAGPRLRHTGEASRWMVAPGIQNVALRILVSAFSFVAAVIVVTDKQTKHIYVASIQTTITTKAKFGDMPAFVYMAVTMFVASLYGLITMLASIVVASKPDSIKRLRLHLVLWDAV